MEKSQDIEDESNSDESYQQSSLDTNKTCSFKSSSNYLKKAKHLWQVKNKHKFLLSPSNSGKRNVLPNNAQAIIPLKKTKCCVNESIQNSIDDVDSKIHESEHVKESKDFISAVSLSSLNSWSQNRSSSVGILMKSIDEVVELAHMQVNDPLNFHPQQLKHIMKGIADNSINRILEATGTAPGKNAEKSLTVIQEDLEDKAVTEVIRQQGIQAASCSRIVNETSIKDVTDNEMTSNKDLIDSSTNIELSNNNSTSSNCKSHFEYPNVSQEDVINAAVFSAISDKGLGLLPI